MIIDRRTLILGATATCSGFVFGQAQASVLLDLSKVEYGLPKIKGYLIDCTTSKGLKFPHGAAVGLANATDPFANKQAPNEPEVVDWLIGTLTSAGASAGDARGFSECVRSVADIYGKIVEEFIKSTFGDAVIRTDDGKEIKMLLPKNLQFRENNAFKVEWDGEFGPVVGGVIVSAADIVTVPKWSVIATCAIALLIFVDKAAGSNERTLVEQLFNASKEFSQIVRG